MSDWGHACAMDAGVRNFAIVCGLVHPETELIRIWAAIKIRNSTSPVDDVAAFIKRVYGAKGVDIDDVDFIIDPAAQQRTQTRAETVLGELGRLGIWANPGQNDVEGGVYQVRRRMRHRHLLIEEGPATEDLTTELEEYLVEVDPNVDDGQFKVKKVADHCADALRYLCMAYPWEPPDLPPAESTAGAAWWEIAGPPPKPGGEYSSVMGSMA